MLTGRLCGAISARLAAVHVDRRRRPAARTRRSSAASSSCRSPEGPSSEKNSPSPISRSMPSTATSSPNVLTRPVSETAPVIVALPRSSRSGQDVAVGDEAVDVLVGVLHRHQPLLDLAPGRQERAAVVLHQPVGVAVAPVEPEEVAEVADRVREERDAALGAGGHHPPGQPVPVDDVLEADAPSGRAAGRGARTPPA